MNAGAPRVIYREYPLPDAALGAATCAWRFVLETHDPPAVVHSVPPDGTTNLVLTTANNGAAYRLLLGPRLHALPLTVARGWRYVGLRLRPEAVSAVTGRPPVAGANEPLPPDVLAPIFADLAALAKSDGEWRDHARIGAALSGVVGEDAAIAAAVDQLDISGGRTPIASLAAEAGLGERHFRRRFLAATGVSPKQYASVRRVREALILAVGEASWAEAADAAGFADQPHLARDIKERFGAAPGRVAGYFGGIRHELVAPVRFVQDCPRRDG